jgi:hypothetical protein
MNPWGRLVASGTVGALAACALSSCGSSPAAKKTPAGKGIDTSTTTTTTIPSTSTSVATTTTGPGVAVPSVVGFKIAAARAALRAAGLPPVSLNAACNRGTLASQSVVTSLSVAGQAPDARVGAVPLNPGATVPPGTRVGVTWSGCYGNGSPVPAIVGLTHALARHALLAVGLAWACYSVGRPTTAATASTTTTISSSTSSTTTISSSTSTTAPAVTTTTAKPVRTPGTVLTQNPAPGAVLKPGTIVSFTMQVCPQ